MSTPLNIIGLIRIPSLGRRVQGLLLAIALTVTAAACDGVTLSQVQGVLENVDSISGVATIQLKDGSTITVDLSEVDLQAAGTVIGSIALNPGDEVSLNVDEQGKAHEIETQRSEVKGTLKAVDSAAGTITTEHDGGTQTLTVSPDVKVEVGDNEQSSLVDLTLGSQLEVKVDTISGLVVKIENDDEENGHEGEDREGVTSVKSKGTITALDEAAHTIAVTAPDGTVSVLTVTPSTKVDLEGPDTFAGLKVGMNVIVRVNPDTNVLLKVQERDAGDGEHDDDDDDDEHDDDDDDDHEHDDDE